MAIDVHPNNKRAVIPEDSLRELYVAQGLRQCQTTRAQIIFDEAETGRLDYDQRGLPFHMEKLS